MNEWMYEKEREREIEEGLWSFLIVLSINVKLTALEENKLNSWSDNYNPQLSILLDFKCFGRLVLLGFEIFT